MDNYTEMPIVFTMDDNYAPMGGVAIRSVILHSDPKKRYRVYVLHRGIKPDTIETLESMGEKHIAVECMNLNDKNVGSIHGYRHSFFPIESTDRLLIPELFRQYEKVVYLDCDVVVNIDIAEAFQADIKGYLLGAVRTCAIPSTMKHNQETLGFTETFKSGALLINTELMCREHVRERCFQLLENDMQREMPRYTWPDQDVLNIVCKGSVRFFSEEWNFITSPLNPFAPKDATLCSVHLTEHKEISKRCKIIHYTGELRPWIYPNVPMGKVFWEIARQTDFYDDLATRLENAEKKRRESFPLYNIKQGSNVVLYGAGKMGRCLWTMLMKDNDLCNIVLWVDKNAHVLSEQNDIICGIEKIGSVEYDQIMIAVGDRSVADSIKADLIKDSGCKADKIIWAFEQKGF